MATYFSNTDTAQRAFTYVTGLTGDEFYTDSGMKVDLKRKLWSELKAAGYQRIVFYHAEWGLWAMDEESFRLMQPGSQLSQAQPPYSGADDDDDDDDARFRGPGTGLRMGYWGNSARGGQSSASPTGGGAARAPERLTNVPEGAQDGENSHIWMNRPGNGRLRFQNLEKMTIYRNVRTWILEQENIKTAFIIEDADEFHNDGEMMGAGNWQTLYNDMVAARSENTSIIIFIFADDKNPTYIVSGQLRNDTEFLQNINSIQIVEPNALEIRNMILHFQLEYGMRVRMRELPEIAREITCQLARRGENSNRTDGVAQGVRIKALYHYFLNYTRNQKPGEELTVDTAYKVLDGEKTLSSQEQLDRLIGMESVKKEIAGMRGEDQGRAWMETLRKDRLQPAENKKARKGMMNIVLTGNPGTGKTTVARLLGQIFKEQGLLETGKLVEAGRSDLVAGYVGQTAIKTRALVERSLGGVLFIDEAYSLAQGGENDFGQEAVDELVKDLSEYEGQLIVVMAGYHENMMEFISQNPNKGLARRFPRVIHIEDYTPDEMRQILLYHLRERNLAVSRELEAKLPDFCTNWVEMAGENWGNAGEAVTLATQLEMAANSDPGIRREEMAHGSVRIIEERHIPEKYRPYLEPVESLRRNAVQDIMNMTGLQAVKAVVQELQNGLIVGNLREPGHYLFLGNPGTGKTTVARKMGMLFRNHGVLKRGHVVEYAAGTLVAETMKVTNQGKGDFQTLAGKALDGVLFIDEAYQLLNTPMGRDIIDSLMTFMENNRARVCVILAGYPNQMRQMRDENPGMNSRIKREIYFEDYTGDQMYEILVSMLRESGYRATDRYLERSHRALAAYTKAHIGQEGFGNARYIRGEFLEDSVREMNQRLVQKYKGQDIPEEERNLLTGDDIPANRRRDALKPLSTGKKAKSAREDLEEMVGFAQVKSYLKRLLETRLALRAREMEHVERDRPLHMMLIGNPGTGKTTVAKLVGKVYHEIGLLPKSAVITVGRDDLVAGYVGQTAQKTKKVIEEAMCGVLFIDEAYSLAQGGEHDFGQEAINVLVQAMTEHKDELAIIAAGYPREMAAFRKSNSGLSRRFGANIFTLEDYTTEELLNILKLKVKQRPAKLSPELEEKLPTLIDTLRAKSAREGRDWGNGGEMENLEQRLLECWSTNPDFRSEQDGEIKIPVYTLADVPQEILSLEEQAQREQQKQDYTLPARALSPAWESFDLNRDLARVEQAVVLIHKEMENGEGDGSGFLLTQDGYILTCNHVVQNAKNLQVRLRLPGMTDGPISWHTARVVRTDEQMDAALIKIEGMGYPTLPICGPDKRLANGTKLCHVAYPFGGQISDSRDELLPSLFQGTISSTQVYRGIERAFVNMEAKSGCSGGPVMDQSDGTVVGILCGSSISKGEDLTEEINYILPLYHIWEAWIRNR